MFQLSEYTITEKIYQGIKTTIYRGYHNQERYPVIIKTLKEDYPEPQKTAQFYHEYELTKDLNLNGIIKHYGLQKYKNKWVLILEDIQGTSLKDIIAVERLELMTVLTIMIQLAETLTDLHQHDIIHKDIKPANIIVNLATQEIRLIDFSISAQLNFDHQTLSYPTVLEGSLTYLAPEQTGRMNCPLDARTDLYSLGIVFYELLMGHPPFRSIDAVDLIHSHLAKQPIPPHILKPQIPALISDIIMKLLAKTPEARYQSAYGLKRDLQKCQQQLQTQDKLAPFTLAQEDITPTLHLPLKLYGREAEIKILVDTLRRIKQGHSAILFIKAAAGMGKTALVQELQRVVVQQGGFFISGKFEQFQTIPYNGFFQALRELVHQILTLSEEQIVTWKTALQQSLGANIQVIIDFLPELTLIVEPQAPVESLPFVEHQNRFYLVFQKFIQLFGRKDQPLVLFLDDMHWADHATLKLIQTLMTDRQALWLIGAYRDNELNVTHPLTVLQTQLQESDIPLQELQLMSLELGQINALVSDSLHCPPSHSLPLAELIIKKTAGNPFFIHEFLKTLYHQQLLQFNRQNRIWYWDVEAIQQCAITDNVVELMIKRIETLPESTQTVLKLAACLGNQFELTTLALIYEHSPADTLQALWVALEMGLCLPSQHSYHNHAFLRRQHQHAHPFYQEPLIIHYEHYRFLHDRIQQAAYCLISETEKPKLHYQIGQLLYQYHVISEGYLFEIVNHLNKGQSLIKTAAERQQLAQLNLHVGRKAKMTNAYANAVNYLKTGLALLPNHSWHNHHALTLALHIEYLEAAYLNAEFEQLEALADLVIQQAQSTLEVIRVYELKMLYHLSQNQGVKALEQGLAVLAQLNITLDSQCVDIDVLQFTQLPEMKDVNSLAALHILMIMAPAAYINRPQLVSPLVSTMVNLCIRQGNTVLAAYGYAIYGLQLCGHKEDIEVGYQAAQLALKVLEQFPSKALHAKVYQIIYCHIQPWKHHLETTLTPLQQAIQTALEQGDLHYVGYSAMLYCDHLFFLGEPLTTVHQKQSFYLEMLHTLKLQFQCDYLSLGQHSVSNLLSATPSCELTQTEESVLLTAFTQAQNIPLLYIFHLHKCILHYLFNHYTAAIQHAQAAQDYQAGGFGLVHSAELNFYYSLALLAATQQTHQRKRYVHQVKKNQVEMLCWAFHSPMNFQHKYDLIAAELARLDARIPEAMALYDQAIEAANTQGYIQETAIAHELAARFYFELERHKIANLYLIEAYQAYLTWGAYAKVKDLEKQYPFLLAQLPTHATTLAEHTMTLSHAKEQLDLNSVIKASQTISSEIVFEQLLKKLMYIILEHSGAEQAWLLLRKDMQWGIEAYANLEETQILNALALESVDRHSLLWLSKAIVTYVVRTQVPLVLADASHHHLFAHDAYILERQPKSILAMPIIHKDELIGIIYLENNLMAGAFSATRLAVLKLLTVQIAISLENARFYTQLKQVQRHAEQARYEAEAANRAKTSFLANMSHELRTPLNAILGYSDLIQEEAQDLDYQEILTDLDKIQTASRQLLGIISDILNISKIEAEKLELNLFEFNVAHVIDEVVTTVQPLIKNKDNVLVIEYTNELGTIYADRHKVAQILINLLSNAAKFTLQGTITLTITRKHMPAEEPHSEWLYIQVEDSGVGISPEQLNKIFEAFSQADNSSTREYGGTGLGLTICDYFCRALGGNIFVSSELGKGSVFTVQLPTVVSQINT